jgi:hypothetical protein
MASLPDSGGRMILVAAASTLHSPCLSLKDILLELQGVS